jgi:hypothetical protein
MVEHGSLNRARSEPVRPPLLPAGRIAGRAHRCARGVRIAPAWGRSFCSRSRTRCPCRSPASRRCSDCPRSSSRPPILRQHIAGHPPCPAVLGVDPEGRTVRGRGSRRRLPRDGNAARSCLAPLPPVSLRIASAAAERDQLLSGPEPERVYGCAAIRCRGRHDADAASDRRGRNDDPAQSSSAACVCFRFGEAAMLHRRGTRKECKGRSGPCGARAGLVATSPLPSDRRASCRDRPPPGSLPSPRPATGH